MTFYAVIDTNVLVSALLSSHFDAATVQVVNRIFDGDIVTLFSEEILAEYNEVLRREKFKFSGELVEILIEVIKKHGKLIHPESTGEILPDMKDLPFYEVVIEGQGDDSYLVTGNLKHFPPRPFIVTAREFLEIMDEKNTLDQNG